MEDNPILTAQQLRKVYLPTTAVSKSEQQLQYYQFLTSKGLIVNPKVTLSVFQLKNGLPYIGMAANELISSGEVLIRVPEELILSSAKSLQQPLLKDAYQHRFFINKDQNWEDRAIIVYCMFILHQKDTSHPWYHMISNFPKECDIACFWPQDELNSFKDLTIISAAQLDLQSFDEQWHEFEQCQKQYAILQQKEFNYDNYKNIFINITNRSFGKNINFVSLVPFAEFFNHNSSKVYYIIEKQKKTELKDENVSDDESSVGSFDSNQYIEQGQFKYDGIDVTPYNWQVEQSYELNPKQVKMVKQEVSRLMNLLDNNLNWQDFTVLFVGHLILKLKIIQKQYLVGRKPYQRTLVQLKIVENSFDKYRIQVAEFYKVTKKRDYMKKKQQKKPPQAQFKYPQYKKEYENLVIKTSKFDKIQPNNQIYFRYGRNSNRSLLLRYGFAIEGNKYEHAWVSFSIAQCFEDFPDMLEKVMDKKLSLLRKFKIHHHILNMDMIIFFRLNNWSFYHEQAVNQIFKVINIPKELVILQQILSILHDNLDVYAGEYDLTDKDLSYHRYFIAVYHRQKYNIIEKQINMLKKIVDILNAINQGRTKQEATSRLSRSQSKVLAYYINSIQTHP